MAGSMHEISPWKSTIPPNSRQAWLRLAVWQLWIGVLLCGIVGFGTLLIVTAPDRVITVPVPGVVYRTGTLYALFSLLAGLMMFVLAAWFLWELWTFAAPKPITDDFLKLLHDSFARKWRDPRTWPWTRMWWAYGFTLLGATLTAGLAVLFWTLLPPSQRSKPPIISVETSQIFRLAK
jgi:hypothetical protein